MVPAFLARSRGLSKLYNRLFLPLLDRHGLTQTEADILLFLANNPECDTAHDIVERRHLAKSHISSGVDRLAARGLLERFLREGNRKTIHLRLTGAAWPIIEEGRVLQARYGALLADGFSEAELRQFQHFLDRIIQNVDRALDCPDETLCAAAPPAQKEK